MGARGSCHGNAILSKITRSIVDERLHLEEGWNWVARETVAFRRELGLLADRSEVMALGRRWRTELLWGDVGTLTYA